MNTKICSKCGDSKPLEQFSRASKEKSGRKSRCKTCVSEDVRAYRDTNHEHVRNQERLYQGRNRDVINVKSRAWYAANKEQAKQTRKAWREQNAEKDRADVAAYQKANANKLKEAERKWVAANSGKVLAYARKHRETNREQFLKTGSEWRKRNRHKVNAKKSHRKAAQLQATPAWSDRKKVEEFYFAADFLGMVTGEWYHVDHVVPIRSDRKSVV